MLKRTTRKVLSDDKCSGNTTELLQSIHTDVARTTAKALYPNIDVDKLTEEELDDFAELGHMFHLLACGFHASPEDLERLEKTGHL
ncbi:hypothetical protein IJ103_03845 [Candidatus Saccharibacteria bacterium]|nr:hypothetical protein [Candidatus Saccharibacteria bacterium]